MRDSRALTDQIEGFDPPTEEQQELARRTVCSFAFDANDAGVILRMLGLHPLELEDEYSSMPVVLHPVALM